MSTFECQECRPKSGIQMMAAPLFPMPGIREVGLSTWKYPQRLSMKTFMYDEEGGFEHNCTVHEVIKTTAAAAINNRVLVPAFSMY